MNATALADAAEALLGTPYRLHGRDPRMGVDCVGLIIAALRSIGMNPVEPPAYAMRNRSIDAHRDTASAMGLMSAMPPVVAGDILLTKTGAAQFHLLIAARNGDFVHAHAGLRRVVMTPGPICWPIEDHWRLTPQS